MRKDIFSGHRTRCCQLTYDEACHLFWTQNKVLSTDLWWGMPSFLDTEQGIVNWPMMRLDIFSGHNKVIVNCPMLRHDIFSGHRTRYCQMTYDEAWYLFWALNKEIVNLWWGMTSFLDTEQKDCQLTYDEAWHLFWTQNRRIVNWPMMRHDIFSGQNRRIVNWPMMRHDIFSGHNRRIVNWPMMRHGIFSGHRTKELFSDLWWGLTFSLVKKT